MSATLFFPRRPERFRLKPPSAPGLPRKAMPVYHRKDIPALLQSIDQGQVSPVYLICGDRVLCQQAADDLVRRLLPDEGQRRQNLILVDGDREEPDQTLARLKTFGLFPGRRVIRVKDSKLFYSKDVARTLWDKAAKARADKDARRAQRYLLAMLGLAELTGADWTEENLEQADSGRWQALFGFPRPAEDLAWVGEALAQASPDAAPSAGGRPQVAELFAAALESGVPANNTIILLAEAVDKRKRLYKAIGKLGVILDLALDPGASKAAVEVRTTILRDLVRTTLAGLGKKIEPRVLDRLLERVGFHPDAVVLETEKLALSVEDRDTITLADLDCVVGRTREEALFEFTEVFTDGNLERALIILAHLLDNGGHPLMVLAGLHNLLKRQLQVKALQADAALPCPPGQGFGPFQQGYLARLKAARPESLVGLPTHPYALYMLFCRVESLAADRLITGLTAVLRAEMLLKSTSLAGQVVLEDLPYGALLPTGRRG